MTTHTNITIPPVPVPKVLRWFKIYAIFLCGLYLCVIALSLVFLFVDPREIGIDSTEAIIVGVVLLAMGLVFFTASTLPLFLRARPWLWTYDLVLICIGMMSILTLPFSVALLIAWLKPEVKAYFAGY
jgi:uncharacterized membrane protein